MSPVIWPGEGFKDNTAYIEIGGDEERLLAHLRSPETQAALRWAAESCERIVVGNTNKTRGGSIWGQDALDYWADRSRCLRALLVEPVEEEDDGVM